MLNIQDTNRLDARNTILGRIAHATITEELLPQKQDIN